MSSLKKQLGDMFRAFLLESDCKKESNEYVRALKKDDVQNYLSLLTKGKAAKRLAQSKEWQKVMYAIAEEDAKRFVAFLPHLKKYQLSLGGRPVCVFHLPAWRKKSFISRMENELSAAPCYGADQVFPLDHKPEFKWLPGVNPILNYRGNAVNRDKMWLGFDADVHLEYLYTGYQKEIALVQQNGHAVIKNKLPSLASVMKRLNVLNGSLSLPAPNHGIITRYKDGSDFIGLHSDKLSCIAWNSLISVVRFGADRLWEIASLDSSVSHVFRVKSGDVILMHAGATNCILKHGVPKMSAKVGWSGSLVLRHIICASDFDTMRKRALQAKKDKLQRKRRKKKKEAAM